MEDALCKVKVVSDITLLRDFGLDVVVKLRVVLDAEPFVYFSRCAFCSAWAVLCEMLQAAWIQDGRFGVWACADLHNVVVVKSAFAKNPRRPNANAIKEAPGFVLIAEALWDVGGACW